MDIVVHNIVGQKIITKRIENTLGGTFNMDLTDQADGVYFIQIKTDNFTIVKNFIVLRSK